MAHSFLPRCHIYDSPSQRQCTKIRWYHVCWRQLNLTGVLQLHDCEVFAQLASHCSCLSCDGDVSCTLESRPAACFARTCFLLACNFPCCIWSVNSGMKFWLSLLFSPSCWANGIVHPLFASDLRIKCLLLIYLLCIQRFKAMNLATSSHPDVRWCIWAPDRQKRKIQGLPHLPATIWIRDDSVTRLYPIDIIMEPRHAW
jgi:hypothetical protein